MFTDRRQAGAQLGTALRDDDWQDPLVVGMARGGVPVAAEVAMALGAELDVAVVRKIGAPGQPELGIASVTADGPVIAREEALAALGMGRDELEAAAASEREEARRREDRYRSGDAPPRTGRDVVVVDDGLATGISAIAVLRAERAGGPRRLVLAVPVCAPDAAARIGDEADQLRFLSSPTGFAGVGQWYRRFEQLSDEEVVAALTEHRGTRSG